MGLRYPHTNPTDHAFVYSSGRSVNSICGLHSAVLICSSLSGAHASKWIIVSKLYDFLSSTKHKKQFQLQVDHRTPPH